MTPTTPPDPSSHHPRTPAWAEQAALLIDLAVADLEAGGDVLPTMVAFTGDDPLFLATLRPFGKGGHHDPIIEVGALAAGLSADRVMVSLSGRAWSMDDPIPPVLPDVGDLRQRVVVVHQVEVADTTPMALSTIVPIITAPLGEEGSVTLGQAVTDISAVGWVPQALMAVVGAPRPSGGADLEDLGLQVRRCERLGHRLAWSPTVLPLIDQARLAGMLAQEPDRSWDAA